MNTENGSERNTQKSSADEQQIQLYMSDLWRGFLKFWWVCLLLILIGGSLNFMRYSRDYVPRYTVSATFTVRVKEIGLADGSINTYTYYYNRSTADQLATTFPIILQSSLLREVICADLDTTVMPAVVSASAVSGSNMFVMYATGTDPQKTYDVLCSAITNYPVIAEYVIGNTELTMIIAPVVPTVPSNPFSPAEKTFSGALIGLLLGAGWILLYACLRQTIRTKRDIAEKLNRPCLGVLPQVVFKRYTVKVDRSVLMTNHLIGEGFLEALRALRIEVMHRMGEKRKVLMISSTAPGEGKTTLAVNLAVVLSRARKRILLIDGDLMNPSVARLSLGLDIPVRQEDPPYVVENIPSLGIDVLRFNPKHPQAHRFVQPQYLRALVDHLKQAYDYVLIDTPPCGLTSDGAAIAETADAALLVVRQDTVRVSRIRYAMDVLLSAGTEVLGCVLNGASSGLTGYGENYGYGYGSYSHYGKYGYGSDTHGRNTEKTWR